MSGRHFHSRYRTIPASLLLDTLGESLTAIKEADKATFKDIGVVLGKSSDRAEAYAKGAGEMGVTAFLRGCREWDGRFANDVLAHVGMRLVPLDPGEGSDRGSVTAFAALLAGLTEALEDDGIVDDDEHAALLPLIDRAAKQIDRFRSRPKRLALTNG